MSLKSNCKSHTSIIAVLGPQMLHCNFHLEVWKIKSCVTSKHVKSLCSWHSDILEEGKVANSQAETIWNCKRPGPGCTPQWLARVPHTWCQHSKLPSTPAACTHTHTLTHTSVHGYLFVRMWLSWVQCAHMTASVKCGFGWQRKESLYLWNCKRLHATALRGGECQTCVPQSCWNVFSLCLENWVRFQLQKNLFLCNFHGPCYTIFFFFFSTTDLCSWISSSFWDEGVWWWRWGALSFSRVYQEPESGCISDFTRGKSKPSAAVDSGEVESAH